MPRPLRVLQAHDDSRETVIVPDNLPVQLTSLVGREGEVISARAQLEQPHVRLLTLTGPPGVGKTRLGISIASNMAASFPDGVYFVPLAPIVGDPQLVLSTIAQVIGAPPSPSKTIYAALEHFLSDKHTLLLLDNFEQVVDAAPSIGDLLLACPGLKVLVTSRELLHLYGEHTLPVPPLALPDIEHMSADPGQLLGYEAVVLFVQRAQAIRPDFRLTTDNGAAVAEICTRLDGLPLAIELAAARVHLLPPHALLTRLSSRLRLLTGNSRNLPPRQQTLRAAIEWGYELLTEPEKTLFRRLSVFIGGCDLQAAESICDDVGEDTLSVLEALLDKSMLRQQSDFDGEPRYWMLETIREYGWEALAAGGELGEIAQHHAEYFLGVAEEAERSFAGPMQGKWAKRLEADHDNLRAAFEWCVDGRVSDREVRLGRLILGLRLGGALGWFWRVRGYLTEGRKRLATALAQIEELLADGSVTITPEIERAWALALNSSGWLAVMQGGLAEARPLYEESLARFRTLKDVANSAIVLVRLGALMNYQGDRENARRYVGEGLELAREIDDKQSISTSLNVLGELARIEGDYDQAEEFYRESLSIKRELGGAMGMAVALHNLARVAQYKGDYTGSEQLFEEGLLLFVKLASTPDVAVCLAGLGGCAAVKGDGVRSARLLGSAIGLLGTLGAAAWPADRADFEHDLELGRSSLPPKVWAKEYEVGQSMQLEEAIALATEKPEVSSKKPALDAFHNMGELTSREVEVLGLLAQGLTNAEIATRLVLSRRTVHAHLQSIFSKLDVNSRTAAVSAARNQGLLP